mmetsp:Transcript_515/g.1710  ORF Transcript_515/g.1710 Transcript_515/m.1710 type:complete len:329 (-) Transcript_515:762-1748(-)
MNSATVVSDVMLFAKACRAHRGVTRSYFPGSCSTKTAFCFAEIIASNASFNVSVGLQVGTASNAFMTTDTLAWSAPVFDTSSSESMAAKPRATSRAEKTPSQPPSMPLAPLTTRWWQGSTSCFGACAMSQAASVNRTLGGTSKCCGIVERGISFAKSQLSAVPSGSQPYTKARMRSFSVSSLSGAASSLKARAVDVRPEVASKVAASLSEAPLLQTAVRCHCCVTSSPTVGPAHCRWDRMTGVRALEQRARSKDETVPMASALPGATTTKWFKWCIVIIAAASATVAVPSISRGPAAGCIFRSQSETFVLLGTPSAKARTASRGVTMP